MADMKNMDILFYDDEHEKFFFDTFSKVRYQDVYHMALCYCLGISADTRRNFNRIYEIKTGCVKPECLQEGWQTSGTTKIVRMAFNLYCNGTPSILALEDPDDQLQECQLYTPESLFCCSYAPYFVQAIKLRYPEYF